MDFVSADILSDVVQLSWPWLAVGWALGVFLLVCGWWSHRFWAVLIITVLAGIFGLNQAPDWNMQPLVAALSMAAATGMVALALVRLAAFAAGGIAALLTMHVIAPSWPQPLLVFLVGGILGVLLFRMWIMALTSFVGSIQTVYCTLGLVHLFRWVPFENVNGDVLEWINWGTLGLCFVGFVFQFIFYRRKSEDDEDDFELVPVKAPSRWFFWFNRDATDGNSKRAA